METENKSELVFADLPAGRTFRALNYPVTKELVQDFMETVGDANPLYRDDTSLQKGLSGPAIGPPGLAAIYSRLSYLQDHIMPSGGVLAKQEFEFHCPIRVGDRLQVKAKVTESYLDERERKRVTFLIETENQQGELISTIRLYAIWPK